MKTKFTCLSFLGVVVLFAILNLCKVQVKNGEKLSIYNVLLQTMPLETLAEAEDFPENFPVDPWWESGSGNGAKVREVTNSYTYFYLPSGNYFLEYVCPMTSVNCYGIGEVPCITNVYLGDRVLNRIVTEDQKHTNS
ncbi:hypothetical protein [Bacteroides thetaiotaomicron]|uniref:hypothetical protein n=1 Tax=Bacteroides thetaiotaomicron TaxID=818 RepID=UPI001F2A00C1|nr:hypothetical protein [Bacteroides thetaiotaomicron]MCE9079007.1 hypothetical protein [Bacteroides thetaiotaomicron]